MAVFYEVPCGQEDCTMFRSKVPGGWLVLLRSFILSGDETNSFTATNSITFYPDPEHTWDGGSWNR